MRDNRGSVTLLGLLFCSLIFGQLSLQVTQYHQHYKEIKARAKCIRCLKKITPIFRRYFRGMVKQNKVILTTYLLYQSTRWNPKTAPALKLLLQFLKYRQQLYHVSYLKKIALVRVCPRTFRTQYALKPPFKHQGIKLKRSFNGTVQLKQRRWQYFLRYEQFNFKLSYGAHSHLRKKHKLKIKDLRLLNWFSGAVSSVLLPSVGIKSI